MLVWFLRLFPAYRELDFALKTSVSNYEKQSGAYGENSRLKTELQISEGTLDAVRARLAELEQENIRLQDRLEFAQADRARVWDSFEASLANERMSYQMQINSSWQQKCGVTPFPDAPHLPDSQSARPERLGPIGPGVRLMSDVVDTARHNYWTLKNRPATDPHGVAHEQVSG